MKRFTKALVLPACLCYNQNIAFANTNFEEGKELVLVQVVQRHGARTPSWHVEKPEIAEKVWGEVLSKRNLSKETNFAHWNVIEKHAKVSKLLDLDNSKDLLQSWDHRRAWSSGRLTKKGMVQLEEQGKKFREKYIKKHKFLPDNPNNLGKCLQVFSTNCSRTILSADNFLYGMYPNASSPFEIQIHTGKSDEFTGGGRLPWPKGKPKASYKPFQEKYLFSTNDLWLAPLYQYLQSLLGHQMKHESDKFYIADNIKCYDYEGISIGNIEKYINRGNIDAMKHYGFWMVLQKFSDENMLKFRTTMLIDTLSHRFEHESKKFYLNSCHDTTLIPLYTTFGDKLKEWPPFASAMVFEIWKDKLTNQKFIRIFYNDEQLKLFKNQEIEMELNKFLKSWKSSRNHIPGGLEGWVKAAEKEIVPNQI